jgi:NADPH2:quinone reductase
VIATASSDEKLARLKALGLDHGINYATDSFVEQTRQLTDSRGVDIVIDSIGGQNLVDSVGVLAYRGTLVSVGVAARAGSSIEARSLWTRNNTWMDHDPGIAKTARTVAAALIDAAIPGARTSVRSRSTPRSRPHAARNAK